MEQPSWFYIAVLETASTIDQLTTEFNQLCCTQPGVLNHGWRITNPIPRSTKKYLFQVISNQPINQEVLFDLSMRLHQAGNIISEATNCVGNTELSHTVVVLAYTGFVIIGKNPTIDKIEKAFASDIKTTYLNGFITVTLSRPTLIEAIQSQRFVETILKNSKMPIICTFRNSKD